MIVNQLQIKKSMLLKHALEQGWEVVAIYSDDDYSGTDNNRPGFNKMIEECEKEKWILYYVKLNQDFQEIWKLLKDIFIISLLSGELDL